MLSVSQTACEKTFSVMHHVIQRTISYAHGTQFGFKVDLLYFPHCEAWAKALNFPKNQPCAL